MKKILRIIVALVLLALVIQSLYPQKMKLEVGDKVPLFKSVDQNGNDFEIKDLIGKKAMVIYFYPKDDTPGCTKEACSFRDEYETFTDLNVEVIGISADDVASHKKFAQKYNLPFTLLSDSDLKIRKMFDVKSTLLGILPGRVTYVIDKKGIVRMIFKKQFGAEKHITESLIILKEINK